MTDEDLIRLRDLIPFAALLGIELLEESKTNFLRAVRDGAVTAITRPLHKGRTLIVLETGLSGDDGRLAAKVTQTQAFSYPRP
jgi:uncharacterized protein (TIGR00369 family)